MSAICKCCNEPFHLPPEQVFDRKFCRPCEGLLAEVSESDTWRQLAEFVNPIVADLGASQPVKPEYPCGIDDMEF